MTDPFVCPHCKSRRGLELVNSINEPWETEVRRCLDCGKSTLFVKPQGEATPVRTTTANGHEFEIGEEQIKGVRCYSCTCWTCNFGHAIELLPGDEVNEPARLMVQKLMRDHCSSPPAAQTGAAP